MNLIDKYNKAKKRLIIALCLLMGNFSVMQCSTSLIASFYENSIERSYLMQYALLSYFNVKKWLVPSNTNTSKNNSFAKRPTSSFSRLFKKPSLQTGVNPLYNPSNFLGNGSLRAHSMIANQLPLNVQQTMNHGLSLSSNHISSLIKNTIKERREYLDATQWMHHGKPSWLQYSKPRSCKSDEIVLDQWKGYAEGIEPDTAETAFSKSISDKVSLLFNRLQECDDVFKILEKKKIKPINKDELYSNAQGILVEPIRNVIKNTKQKLGIRDEFLIDGYSKALGGGHRYIVVGKNSKGFFKGVRKGNDDALKVFNNAKIKHNEHLYRDVLEHLQGDFKIHLQAASRQQFLFLIEALITLAHENNELRESLAFFKAYTDIDFDCSHHEIAEQLQKYSKDGILPTIVLYPATGKEHAQKVLDIIYKAFGSLKGLDYAPAYNEKVTSLIYIAQGNRDNKQQFEEYFNEPRVYFNDLLGIPSYKYRLKNPRLNLLLHKYKDAVAQPHSLARAAYLIEKIKRKNFSLTCADDDGYTLLDYAYLFNNPEIINALQAYQARCLALTPRTCIEMNNNEVLPLLLKYKNLDDDENSLFYYALKYANADALALLHENKLNIDALNRNLRTPLGQFIHDINEGTLVVDQRHIEALKRFLLLWPSLGRVSCIAYSTIDEIRTQLADVMNNYTQAYNVYAKELRSWQLVD